MMFIIFLITGLLTTGIELRCSNNGHHKKKITTFLINTLFVNLFSLFLLRFVLKKQHLFLNETYTFIYSFKYLIVAMAVALAYLFFKYTIHHSTHLKECSQPRTKKEQQWLIIDSVLFLVGWFLLVSTNWLEPWIRSETRITNQNLISSLDAPILLYVTGTVIFISFLWAPVHVVNNYRTPLPNGHLRKIGGLFAALLFIVSLINMMTLFH
ncbi:hypothetical protein IV487_11290 [Enterococcus saccharolyticus]|uniref:Uncharacterized protein n=1 Tax=Candidatus Enterococcus willemsii TaxID=1857215 RepID=A0ABQ6Z2R2_9ENTE|nr:MULTISPECIES: hypothetical protein [Enterococcus]KAF1305859.1 hypothetical protein BAU17_13105 [Enterococcus sp. CU12B]MCD5003048.1 hypothetical protein [Enterococcus saccharolyticus]